MREALGKAIYMQRYKEQGAIWSANDSKETWYKLADELIEVVGQENQKEIDQLKAQVEGLRYLADGAREERAMGNSGEQDRWLDKLYDSLEETPAQSLQEHDINLLERIKNKVKSDGDYYLVNYLRKEISEIKNK